MRHYLITVDGREYDITLELGGETNIVTVNGRKREVITHALGENRALILIDGQSLEVDVRTNGYDAKKTIFMHGMDIPITIEDFHLAQLRKTAGIKSGVEMERILRTAMPGLVHSVLVGPGDKVVKNQPLVIIEAMKMENIIKSQGEGIVKAVFAEKGKSVEKNDKLMEFE